MANATYGSTKKHVRRLTEPPKGRLMLARPVVLGFAHLRDCSPKPATCEQPRNWPYPAGDGLSPFRNLLAYVRRAALGTSVFPHEKDYVAATHAAAEWFHRWTCRARERIGAAHRIHLRLMFRRLSANRVTQNALSAAKSRAGGMVPAAWTDWCSRSAP